MASFAFVTSMPAYPSGGGSEELWLQAAVDLVRRGHRVAASVQGWEAAPEPLERLRAHGVRVHERPAGYAWSLLWELGKVSRLRLLERTRDAWLRRCQPDLVCISSGDVAAGVPWLAACRRLGLPYVTVVQSNGEHWWPGDVLGPGLRDQLLGARRCFFVARANLALVETQIGERLPNAEIVRNPCKVARIEALPWPSLKASAEYRLACVGRLSPPSKGQDLVLGVLALPQWGNRSLTVSFYGDGPNRKGLGDLAVMLGVADRVTFRGYAKQIEDVWADHHALFLPSRREGLPLVLVEAMACGRPAVVTDVAGNSEMVLEGETGFLAAAPTLPLVAEALERAWERRADWQELGSRAFRHVREQVPRDAGGAFAARLEQQLGP